MSRTPVAPYRPGTSFECTRQSVVDVSGSLDEPCGAAVVMHGFHWCAQVCPACLAVYWASNDTASFVYRDHGAFYPPDVAATVRANIAGNGGQYVPTF